MAKQNKAYKFRLYPTKEQELVIRKTFGCVRFVYNKMLAERIDTYESLNDDKEELKKVKHPTPAKYKKEKQLIKIDKWFPSTKTCSSCGNTQPMPRLGYTLVRVG